MMKKNQNPKKLTIPDRKDSVAVRDELKSTQDPFIVPDFYFSELPQQIMDRINGEKKDQKVNLKSLILLKQTLITLAMAATVAIFIFLRLPSTHVNNAVVQNSAVATTHSNEYDPTYAEEALLIEESAITEQDEAHINIKSMSVALNKSDTTNITTGEKIQYLLNENYDTGIITDL